MVLLLDIGNTCIKFSSYDLKKNKIGNPISYFTYNKKTLYKIVKYVKIRKIKYVLASSVVPKVYNSFKKKFSKEKIKVYEYKDKKINKFIKINVKNKKQVGSDRIVNAFGSLNYYKENCIIIDFGTATTFDIADKNNIYQGGIIAPGVKLSLQTLNRFTAKLPLVKLSIQKKVIGKDTQSAINSGLFIGYSCLINGIIDKILKETKKKYLIILTGGYSKIFKNKIDHKCIINKDITLYGLALSVKKNKKVFSEKK